MIPGLAGFILAARFVVTLGSGATPVPPHIVVVLADDLGWANVGWNREVATPEVVTPVLDGLVREGIELTQFYAFKYCSPTRSALQSGRNPVHVNVQNIPNTVHNPAAPDVGFAGIALNFTTLPEKMRQAGFVPHAVGKWHCGMATLKQTPAGRGYQTWLGYFGACNDYWTDIDKCGAGACGIVPMVDLWEQDRGAPGDTPGQPFRSRPALGLNNSQSCSQANQQGCRFEDDLLLARVKDVVAGHPAGPAPLFLFWATHAAHGPRQVPSSMLDRFSFIDWPARRTYHALVTYLDGLVGKLVDALVQRQMWTNTLLVFCGDNGGDDQANNYPQRGAKFSNWQGGIHVPAFVTGGALPAARRGIKLAGLAAVWDLYATVAMAGGVSEAEARADPTAAAAGLPAVDSISQWGYWAGLPGQSTPPRTELVVGGEVGNENGAPSGVRFTGLTASNTGVEAIIVASPGGTDGLPDGPSALWKFMLGTFHFAAWTGPVWPNASSTSFAANNSQWSVVANCTAGCLYNLTADPTEHRDVAAEHPEVAAALLRRLLAHNASAFSPDRGQPDKQGCVVGVERYGGFWGPFLDLGR